MIVMAMATALAHALYFLTLRFPKWPSLVEVSSSIACNIPESGMPNSLGSLPRWRWGDDEAAQIDGSDICLI